MIVFCCHVEVSATGQSLVQRSPAERDHEALTMRGPGTLGTLAPWGKKSLTWELLGSFAISMSFTFNAGMLLTASTECSTRYRTWHYFNTSAPCRNTTDTHYRYTLQTHTTDTFLFISHTTNVLLFKYLCNTFICVRIIKEMPGSVASWTPCTKEST
jgi:hypothetical protein